MTHPKAGPVAADRLKIDYPSIERQAAKVRLATVGKRGHERRLKALRLSSLKREVRRGAALRAGRTPANAKGMGQQ